MTGLDRMLADNAAALRAVARLLVGDGHADDLVQETSLHVLRRPPPAAVPLRRWLTAVLRNRASKLRRGEGRRTAREQARAAADEHAATDPRELAQQRETAERLHRALGALPDPYRDALWLRFFQDLSPSAIAARTATPLPTVKSRLQRGLELLRREFAGDRDERDWRGALCAAFALEPLTVRNAAAATGVLAMSTAIKFSLAGACAALALWFSFRAAAAPPAPAAATGPTNVAAATGDVPEPIARPTDAPPARTDAAAAAEPQLPPIHVRLVDAADRTPLPHFAVGLAIERGPSDIQKQATSDARGELQLDGGFRQVRLRIEAVDDEQGSPSDTQLHRIAPSDWPEGDRALELAFRVGPTYALVFADGPPPAGELRAALAAGDEFVFSDRPVHPEQRVRSGPLPWVRFDPSRAVPSELGAGPWTLVVVDEHGHWLAAGAVETIRGVQSTPVQLQSRPCGSLWLEITEDGARARGRYFTSIYRRGSDGKTHGRDHTVQIEAGVGGARIGQLPAGDYRVFVGDAAQTVSRTIDTTVRAGEQTHVTAGFPAPAPRHTLRVVARSQTGTRDLGLVVCTLRRDGDVVPHYAPAEPRDGRLCWTFDDLEDGEWFAALQPTPQLPPWNTTEQRVAATAGTVEFVCLDDGAPPAVSFALQVVDARGQPIARAGVTTFADGRQHYGTYTDVEGNVTVGPYLAGRQIQLLVRAADCAPALVDVVPAVDAAPTRVELAPGWGTMFVVVEPGSGPGGQPLANVDVLLDGLLAGTTDVQGLLLVRAQAMPRRIELRRHGYHFDYGAVDRTTGAPIGGEQSPYFCVMARDG
jgi:RNA polymerase sigma-70 factor (ECF subfamily)